MKTKSTLCILLISTQISFAQDGKLWLSLGAGTSSTASSNKNNLIGNGLNLQAESFVPFYKKTSHFTLGINVAGNYTRLRNLSPNNMDVAGEYQIFNGNLSVASQSNGKTSGNFSGLMGIQGQISFGKFNIAPSLNAGYLRLDQKGFTQMGNATINGQTQEKELVKSENQTTNGFIFKPQIKIGYNIAQNFTVFVGPAIVMGPELTHTTQYLVPQGGFNDRKMYEASQLAKGTWESKTANSRYGLTEVNFGVSVAIGKKKVNVKPSGAVSSSYAKAAPVGSEMPVPNNATDFNTTRNNRERGQLKRPDTLYQEWDNMIAENLSKTPKNADTSTAGMVTKAGVSTSRSGIIRTGNAKLTENDNTNTSDTTGANQRLSMNVTTPKQTQGKTFGESMANGIQATGTTTAENQATERKRVEVLKSNKTEIEAANSKNEYGGATEGVINKQTQGQNFGEKVATGMQSGANNIIGQGASLVGAVMPAGSTAKRSETSTGQTPANPQKNEAQDFNTTRNNKERGQLATNPNFAPGNPIKGIIVKGGKNPGGNMRMVSNGNGEILLDKLQKGSYLFQLAEPSSKSINEKGIKRNEAQARPGNPIKGIIVKGGKNPGGNYINLTVNDKGEIGFDVLETGNYKLIIQTPETPKAEDSKKRVVEKATSGLKDTLKTNV